MAKKLIIDADPGIGDAVAIALALSDPEFDVVGVTAAGGCVSGQQASRNIQALIELLDPPKWPRIGCSESPATPLGDDFLASGSSMALLHGKSGLGDWQFGVADLHHPREAAKVMIELVRGAPHEVTLLTLGPLTNVELACERTPDFLGLLKGLVCLGGTVKSEGDVTPAAEFNIYSNPSAARNVLLSPATKMLVPLDVSKQAVLTFEQFDRLPLRGTPLGRVVRELVPFALRAHHQFLGIEGLRLHEVVALATIARPEFFTHASMALDVEVRGELTRGMTVFDRRGIPRWRTNIDVLQDIDAQTVLDYLARVVRRAAG